MEDVLPPEFRAVLKLSLLSRSQIIAANEDLEKRPQLPIVKELIDAILFSRRLIPSYLVVLAAVVLLYASWKWLLMWSECRKRKSRLEAEVGTSSSVASSSSSTLCGIESPPSKHNDDAENAPLLAREQLQRYEPRPLPLRTWHALQSLLLYQPKPIPSLTAPKNTLPANGTSLTVLLFLGLNLFYLFYRMPLSRAMVFAFADRAGILFVVNLPVLYLLAAKNSQPFQHITGWSYEGLNIFHRRLGEWMIVAATLHAIGMVVAFYDLIAPSGFTIWWYLTRRIIIFGCIAFLLYLGIYFTSIGYVRQTSYEIFLALHIFLQVVTLVMLFFHHHHARPYVGAAVAIWALDRLVARIMLKTKTFTATLEVAADKETVLLHADIPLRRGYQLGLTGGWHAGQHVFLTIPEMGIRHRFQAHPFTIASPAPLREHHGDKWALQLVIRAQNGFSRDLLQYAKLHQHAKICMDGPYSSEGVVHAAHNCDRLCLIAGGSGIAVTYPFAWDKEFKLFTADDIIRNRTYYRAGLKVQPNIASSSAVIDLARFAHFWVRQDARHEGWIAMLPSAKAHTFPAQEHSSGAENAIDLITHRFDTRGVTGEHQRPDINAELEAWVRGDVKQKIDMQHRVCVVVSGPDGLVRDVQNAVASLVREGWTIEIHVEKFGW